MSVQMPPIEKHVIHQQVVNLTDSTPPTLYDDWACLLQVEPGPSTGSYATPSSSPGDGNECGLSVVIPDYGTSSSGVTT